MASWLHLDREGVRLACRDYGGDGSQVLLLHGLAGYSGEWAQTASWLTETHRVLALDARGHGDSTRVPAEAGPGVLVDDVRAVIEEFTAQATVLVGQSYGGLVALLTAARHPALVRALVLVDASPSDGDPGQAAEAAAAVGAGIRRWPVPFPTRGAAQRFFADRFGGDATGTAWAEGLEERDDGWWPRFDAAVMERTLRETLAEPSWPAWDYLECPALLVRADNGVVPEEAAQEMMRRLPHARLVELPGAEHDLHLHRPEDWRAALSGFLAEH